jgi:hypothetical protein
MKTDSGCTAGNINHEATVAGESRAGSWFWQEAARRRSGSWQEAARRPADWATIGRREARAGQEEWPCGTRGE